MCGLFAQARASTDQSEVSAAQRGAYPDVKDQG